MTESQASHTQQVGHRTRDDQETFRRQTVALVSVDPQSTDSEPNAMVEGAITAWLHAKHGRSGSLGTRAAYEHTIYEFRSLLRARGLDLDAADSRRVRAEVALRTHLGQRADAARVDAESGSLRDAEDDLAATRMSALALLAQAYAAHPGRHGGARPGARRDQQATHSAGKRARKSRIAPTALAKQGGTYTRPQRPASPATVNRRLAILSSFYAYALKQGLLRGENPIGRAERQRVESYANAEPLEYAEVDTALAAIDRATPAGVRDYALLLVGLHTGRRLSELADMRREHLTIRRGSRGSITLVWPRVKGGKRVQERLPLNGAAGAVARALLAWLDVLYGEDGRPDPLLPPNMLPVLVSGRDTGVAPGQTEKAEVDSRRPLWISLARNGTFGHPLSRSAIADICEARLKTSKVHALRHTYARALEDAGAKVSQIQGYLGHADLGTTGRYLARLTPDENPYLGRLGDLFLTHQARQTPVTVDSPAQDEPTVPDASVTLDESPPANGSARRTD